MEWGDVDAFCRVIEHGGFTAAARAMGRPKSSVSASVARLEEQLGVRLLQRTTRTVRTTEAGQTFYREVAPHFQRLRELRVDAMALGKSVSGTLRIAAPYEFGAHHLGTVIAAMLAQFPELHIELDVEHARIDPLDRRYDIVFSMFDDAIPDSGRIARRIFSLARGLYASPKFLERHGAPRRPEELTRFPALASVGDLEWSFADARHNTVSVPVQPRLRSANAEVRRQAAVAGQGAARVTSTFCAELVAEGRLVPLLPDWTCAPLLIYAVLPTRQQLPAKVKVLLDALEKSPRGP